MEKYIISKFYKIIVDNETVYIGYTNRSLKQRLREHIKDKEFNSKNVKIELIDTLQFQFTWDYGTIVKYANIVSRKETELIYSEKTYDSIYQKGFQKKPGGTTWSVLKNFVRTNHNNPKFIGLSLPEILNHVEDVRLQSIYLGNFIKHMESLEKTYLKSAISHMLPPERIYLKSFIDHMTSFEKTYLKNFIKTMRPPEKVYLQSFVSNMASPEKAYLNNFIKLIQSKERTYLNNFIKNMEKPEKTYLKSFVQTMYSSEKLYLKNFVRHL